MKYDDLETFSLGADSRRRERLIRTAREHLELALEIDDQSTARYHVRAALQALVIETEGESD